MAEKEIPKILIVDDSPANLTATEALLTGPGVKIYRAESGRAALRLVIQEDFALILLDVKMPEMDGIETAALIRENARTKDTPIIFTTAFCQNDQQVLSAYKIGGVIDFLVKPLVPEILKAKVSVFIDLHKKTSELRLIGEEQQAELTMRKRAEEELHIYQIEVETQNAELRQTRGELEALQAGLEERVRERTQALAESEARFRMMLEGLKDYAVITLDIEGRIADWNAGAEHIIGYRADEIVGRHFSQFYPDEDIRGGKPERALAAATAEGHFEIEDRQVHKDGSRFWARVIIAPMRDDTGKLRGFANIIRDITERKKADERMQTLIESMPDGVLAVNAGGNIVVVNAMAEELFGYPREELLGRPIEMLLPERVRAIHSQRRDGYFAAPAARTMGSGLDLYARRKDGSEFPVDISLSMVDAEPGRQAIAVVRDITSRKKIENEIKNLNAAPEQRVEERTRQLSEANKELETFNQVMVGRELRIVEMKEEVNVLCQELGRAPKYPPIWWEGSKSWRT